MTTKEPMLHDCPLCSAPLEHDQRHEDYACTSCGLAGPLEALEKVRKVRAAAAEERALNDKMVAEFAAARVGMMKLTGELIEVAELLRKASELPGLTATLDELRAHHDELRKNAMPTNCTLCRGSGAAPDEAGPCERCGGWTQHKRLVAAEPDELRKRIAELQQRAACDAETWEEERGQLHARIRERNNECDRIQRVLNQCAEERDQLRGRIAELEARIAELEAELQTPRAVLEAEALRERAEWAEAVTASLLPYQERAVLAEKASAEMRETLSALVYWHDQGSGHIDASWWDAARKLVEGDHGR